ncbi:hypothetical protein TKK_0016864 [Trichogramma kaykai]
MGSACAANIEFQRHRSVSDDNDEDNGNNGGDTEQSMGSVKIKFTNESAVSEVQHTTCSVKTEDLVAKAQSSATRILTGVCTAEEMSKGFNNLEKVFLEKLDQILRNISLLMKINEEISPNARERNMKPSVVKTAEQDQMKNSK